MNNEEITVSVIMITYNHEKFIARAIESVLAQRTDFSVEILISDDASTDGTADVIRGYAEKYPNIRATLRETNVGATKNAYALLTAARGKYLATLEGDDCWTDPEKLSVQVDFLENNPKFIACAHRFSAVDGDGNELSADISWVAGKKVFGLSDFDGITLPSQPSTFVRRNIFREPAHDYSIVTAHPMIGDRVLMLIFLLQGDFAVLDRNMSLYRVHGGGLTETLYKKKKCAALADFELFEKMERYAAEEFGVRVRFDKQKKNSFCHAFFMRFRGGGKEAAREAKEILRRGKDPVGYILGLPAYAVKKIIKKGTSKK